MSDFTCKLWLLPPKLAAIAFFLSQGLTDEAIGMWIGRSPDSVRNNMRWLRIRTGFHGTRVQLALAIREAIA